MGSGLRRAALAANGIASAAPLTFGNRLDFYVDHDEAQRNGTGMNHLRTSAAGVSSRAHIVPVASGGAAALPRHVAG